MRRLLILGILPAVLLLGAACSSDDDGDGDSGGDDPTATAAATEAGSDPTAEPTEAATAAPTEAPTEEPMDDGPILALNGVACTGGWTNLTFGSTGSFEAVFASNDAGDAGTVTITLGGRVFGAEGGTVELPLAVDGDNVVTDSAADFLGNAQLTFDSSGGVVSGVFAAPPAFFNDNSNATLEDFAFDGTSLTTMVNIDFGDGSAPARSEITSSCG